MQQPVTVDDWLAVYRDAFRARRGEKTIHAGGRAMRVRTAGERVLHLPNGHTVKVSVDDSGTATQIEEDDKLHAVVRPAAIRYQLRAVTPAPSVAARVRPLPIRTTAIPRIGGSRVPR